MLGPDGRGRAQGKVHRARSADSEDAAQRTRPPVNREAWDLFCSIPGA